MGREKAHAEDRLRAFVRGSGDARIERTLGTRLALRIVFGAMAARFVASAAKGFAGEIQYELRTSRGKVRRWVVAIEGERARARPGRASAPRITLGLSVADFVRLVTGELHPARALIESRLTVAGDLHAAVRLGAMFGQPA
jgi:putative sterol carrier protein